LEKSVESILYTGKQLLKVQPEAGGADDDVEKNKYHGGTSGKVDLDKIIRYSQLISHTTSEGNPGLDGLYQLPMPAEQQIQSGILYEVSGAEVAEVAEDNSRHETHSPALGESDLFAPVAPTTSTEDLPTEFSFAAVEEDADDGLDDILWE